MKSKDLDIDLDKRPFVVIWEITQACDLSCKHCRAEAEPERHPEELTTKQGKKLLEEIKNFGDNQLVVFSGGDPMIREDTVELVDYGTDIGLKITMTPSGTNSLTKTKIEKLKNSGLKRIALSIDGSNPKTHDEFRQENGSFKQTFKAAKHAKKIDLPLQINTTVCKETVDELPKIRKLVRKLDAVLWSVFFLVPIGRGTLLDPISPERAEKIMKWLTKVNKKEKFGIKTTEAPHYRRVALQKKQNIRNDPNNNIGRNIGITAGNGFMFISHTGEVFPSGFLPKSAGNIKKENVINIYRNSDLFRSLRNPDKLKGKCGVCKYRHICGGSRSRAYAYTGDPLESDPLCEYIPNEYTGKIPKQEFNIKN